MSKLNNVLQFEEQVDITLGKPTKVYIVYHQRKEIKHRLITLDGIPDIETAIRPYLQFYIYKN